MKAGELEEALKSIDKVLKIKKEGNSLLKVENYKFDLMRGKVLNKLQRYDEAEDILQSLSYTLIEIVSSNKSVEFEEYTNMETELDLADVYFQLGKTYLGKDKKIKAKEAFNKSHDIIKELSKIPYFKENPIAITKKHLIYYPVMDELNNLQEYN